MANELRTYSAESHRACLETPKEKDKQTGHLRKESMSHCEFKSPIRVCSWMKKTGIAVSRGTVRRHFLK